MKIIFLDYDGVVNNLVFKRPSGEPTYTCYDNKGLFKPIKIFNKWFFLKDRRVNDMQAIGWLNLLIREIPDIRIVVTSTWRRRKDFDKCLYRAGFKGEIIDKTDYLQTSRANEIQKWLDDNKKLDIEDYIILDDEYIAGFDNHLIQTNTMDGFKGSHFMQIKERWFNKSRRDIK